MEPRPATDREDPLEALARVREEIGRVDAELVSLLARRVELAREAGRTKRAAGLPLVDPAQEREVLERARALAEAAGLPGAELQALLRSVFGLSRRAQLSGEDAVGE